MKRPDPDMFAQIVLTDLATIYSEVARTRSLVELIARHLNIPNIEKQLELHRAGFQDLARQISAESLKKTGLKSPKSRSA